LLYVITLCVIEWQIERFVRRIAQKMLNTEVFPYWFLGHVAPKKKVST